MQWSDLEWVSEQQKVARRLTVGDLLACSGQIALIPAGQTSRPALRDGVWVTTSPMTETVKSVDDDSFVIETVPREGLQIVGFPIVVPASLAQQAASPDDLLKRALASGRARSL